MEVFDGWLHGCSFHSWRICVNHYNLVQLQITILLLAVIHWASLRGDRKCIFQTYFTDHFTRLVFPEIHFGQCCWRNYLQMCTGTLYPSFSNALSQDPISRGSYGFVVGDWPHCIGMLPLLWDFWKNRAPQQRWKLRVMREIVSFSTLVSQDIIQA